MSTIQFRNEVHSLLAGGLWHNTSDDRFAGILLTGEIQSEPDIPDKGRYNTGAGEKGYPFARSLGAISLFDLTGFDHDEYAARYPVSSISAFVPYRPAWGHSVWLELDRPALAQNLIGAVELLDHWKSFGGDRNILPGVEAAHVGPIPVSALIRAVRISANGITASSVEPNRTVPSSDSGRSAD
jgi:hypothetical protein|tara:strand:- start:7409 stop:7960 length:552 start_codon:yes stop_codon:yes gene_type:complete